MRQPGGIRPQPGRLLESPRATAHETMSKAFTRETDAADDDDGDAGAAPPLPAGTRNYLTPQGWGRLRAELFGLGVFWCPGYALTSEDVIVVDSVNYMVFQNVYRNLNADYYALKLS